MQAPVAPQQVALASGHTDIDDVGFMSISVKLMDVPGPKLMDEEKFTQDMFGVSPPTFVTADTCANAHLQTWSLKNAAALPLPRGRFSSHSLFALGGIA
ncbi:MAG: hypothetical protein WAO76_05785 [Georgfuchsia sp.]